MLTVHLDFDEESICKVSAFWKTKKISNKLGLAAMQMLEANLDVLIVCHTNPVQHLSNRNKVERLIKKIPLIVEINAYGEVETSIFAHIQLPVAPWGERRVHKPIWIGPSSNRANAPALLWTESLIGEYFSLLLRH